ncbi:hypothetical protein Patl1_05369 [Pistacia atlantica]|uniref:Uncharacterized protein n=1 Tax=Pistacia atlantica TaxID=434234 RepID=A0ACC1BXC3_9ROSI|nr:hypothetical protein Patl1_05369 [Pistacia atlantica]
MMNEKGFFFFKFGDEALMMRCLEDGPWMFHNRPILLQRWHLEMQLNKGSPRFIPLWVKFYDVPMEYWSQDGMSFIASGVGKPLGMDRITEDTCIYGKGRIIFARILIEVDAAKKLPECIK